jgi:lysophospholipase L1-like esterase
MKDILCFGDSNTYGLVPGTGGRYDWDTRWTGILDQRIREYGYRVVEEGLCGRTTVFDDPLRDGRRGTELLPTLLESHKPVDSVVLMLGTNDCKTMYDASAEVIGKGVERLIDQIRQSDSAIRILLVSPIALASGVGEEGYDPEFDEHSVATSKQLPKVYEKVARKKKVHFLAASQYAKASETDREHLDEEGHGRLADAMTELFIKTIA